MICQISSVQRLPPVIVVCGRRDMICTLLLYVRRSLATTPSSKKKLLDLEQLNFFKNLIKLIVPIFMSLNRLTTK